MPRTYPVRVPSSAPATGRYLHLHLLDNLDVPSQASHSIWYAGEASKLDKPEDFAFRGGIPAGKTLDMADGELHTFDGSEGPVLVSNLSEESKALLGIPGNARPGDKVFNPNFKPYGELGAFTRYSNELAALSFPKSLSSFFGSRGNINYSEKDVADFLHSCFEDLNGLEMRHLLHGNHMAWAAMAYVRSGGSAKGDIASEFYGQQPDDFYAKDIGTVLPAMLYCSALLGTDPVEMQSRIDTDIYGSKQVADYMRKFMHPDNRG